MAEYKQQILTIEDYNELIATGEYEMKTVKIEVSGDTYNPTIEDVTASASTLSKYNFIQYSTGPLDEITGASSPLAQYESKMHTVTFVCDSTHSEYTPPVQYVLHGECAVKPEMPTGTIIVDSEYEMFDYWTRFYDPRYVSIPFNFNTPITSNITLYACWVPSGLLFESTAGDSTISFSGIAEGHRLEYRKFTGPYVSGGEWTPIDTDTEIIIESHMGPNHDIVSTRAYIRGVLENDCTPSNYTQINISGGRVFLSGNINSLWNYENVNAPLKRYCGYKLFQGCDSYSIKNLKLPSVNLTPYCYNYMFADCTNLTEASELPANRVLEGSYSHMFENCTSLTVPPVLSATTLSKSCCESMFQGCSSLTTAPVLPATTLSESCYKGMFIACTNLAEAPVLSAKTLTENCYETMFDGCINLNHIICLATDISAENSTKNWVRNVAGNGIFEKESMMNDWTINNPNGIPFGWTMKNIPDYSEYLTIESLIDNNKVSFVYLGNSNNQRTIEVSTDLNRWTIKTSSNIDGYGTLLATLNSGERLYIRGNNSSYGGEDYVNKFVTTGNYTVYGNIMSLIQNENFKNIKTLSDEYTFIDLFSGTNLILSENHELLLPATTLTRGCYMHMFEGCTLLSVTPKLPATQLAPYCYESMFNECVNLTNAPVLSADTMVEGCYKNMFKDCQSLQTAPQLLSMKLASYCYEGMFEGCIQLTSILGLPSIITKDGCYKNMFANCVLFTTMPDLISTSLSKSCYEGMFKWCLAMEHTTQLPDTVLKEACYKNMFEGCTSLTDTPLLSSTQLAPYCYEGMFKDCELLTSAPKLPATVLKEGCYKNMFEGCTRIVEAPILTAETLVESCYEGMFDGCENLNYIKCFAIEKPEDVNCTKNWVRDVAESGVFTKPDESDIWAVDSEHGIPSGWTTASTVSNYVTFTAKEDNCALLLSSKGTNHTLEYSTNDITWNTLDIGDTISLNNDGDVVYVRGVLSGNNTSGDCTNFSTSGSIEVSGNCNALWNYNNLNSPLKEYCGRKLFADCENLTFNITLPSKELSKGCYSGMFSGCTSLAIGPALPATALTEECYSEMFFGCTSLHIAPSLPATRLGDGCYNSMFQGCTALENPPSLPSASLASGCYYNMFNGCTSLTVSPQLPAKSLITDCYKGMFANCSSLKFVECLAIENITVNTTHGWLHNVSSNGNFVAKDDTITWIIDSEDGIPFGWTRKKEADTYITISALANSVLSIIENKAQTLLYRSSTEKSNKWKSYIGEIRIHAGESIYLRGILTRDNTSTIYTNIRLYGRVGIFGNCNTLWDYRFPENNLKDYCGLNLFSGSTGIETVSALTLPNINNILATTGATSVGCYSGMFAGCTSLLDSPELPSLYLYDSCYSRMFEGCTSLITSPTLPSYLLGSSCYYRMFKDCTSLNTVRCYARYGINNGNSTTEWLKNVSTFGTFIAQNSSIQWPTGENGIPYRWFKMIQGNVVEPIEGL